MVTLLVTSLLLVIVLTFTLVVRLELRNVIVYQENVQARANARLSLELAVARLQETAGADQRVTGTAALMGHTTHPHWMGVWSPGVSDAVWLVSGANSASPDTNLTEGNFTVLVPSDPEEETSTAVKVPLVPLTGTEGYVGWWVGDEGVKARVDVASAGTPQPETPLRQRLLQAQAPGQPDMLSLGAPWNEGENAALFARNDHEIRNRLVSRGTLGLAVQDVQSPALFHDLTVHGYGLPVNVRDGGLKADWSVVTDHSMQNSALLEYYLGARPTQTPAGEDAFQPPRSIYAADLFAFPPHQFSNSDRFFLSSRIGADVPTPAQRAGPNKGILWHYSRLWGERDDQNRFSMVGLHPRVATNLRMEDWLPYSFVGTSTGTTFARDRQHTNSGIMPVISHVQLGIRLRAIPIESDPENEQPPRYRLRLELKPVIGLWNPYNVPIRSRNYLVETIFPPMIQLGIREPDGTERETFSWLRLIWGQHGAYGEEGHQERWWGLRMSNVDFEAGEVRMFSLATSVTASNSAQVIDLVPSWNETAVLTCNLQEGTSIHDSQRTPIDVPAGSSIWFKDAYLQDSHHPEAQSQLMGPTGHFRFFTPEHAMSWLTLKTQDQVFLNRYTGMWNSGTMRQSAGPSDVTVPARVIGSNWNRADVSVENLVNEGHHIATWAWRMRTTDQLQDPDQRNRGWVDANPRAPVNLSRWDGSRSAPGPEQEGWGYVGHMMGEAFQVAPSQYSLGDGHGGNRGLMAVGAFGEQAPNLEPGPRLRGYLGATNTAFGGETHVPVFDIPTAPLVSVGQFQHAQLGRYSFEPGFVAGNSYANVRIPLNQTVAQNYNDQPGFSLFDISYDVNQRIWDRMFFSTLAPDYVGGGNSFDTAFAERLDRLPNPRMKYVPNQGPESIDALLASAGQNGRRGAEALSSRIRILGAFNLNSTSKTAWKAVLSSMVNNELPVLDPDTREMSWESPEAIRFSRFGHVLTNQPYKTGDENHPGFWQGWRKISPEELDALAEAIVEEVRARGPFRSMADFVNRNPESDNIDHRRKGALQAALDRTVNRVGVGGISNELGDSVDSPVGTMFQNDVYDGESTTAGFAGYVLQGDILQSLAPVLSARSDTFIIRAYGSTGGEGAARAWAEAVVQRTSLYVDEEDEPWRNPGDDTLSPINHLFGRRFEIVSFRWLDQNETGAN
ncbi:MAG: hypothetical protein JJU05_09785 [Verrucomicrobia bacterium]|nr:hypothetical protein [Verrucomicrobiota bacterium]MCH8527561.1 hypothetical protein [Kiritimatiellia bacterium]